MTIIAIIKQKDSLSFWLFILAKRDQIQAPHTILTSEEGIWSLGACNSLIYVDTFNLNKNSRAV